MRKNDGNIKPKRKTLRRILFVFACAVAYCALAFGIAFQFMGIGSIPIKILVGIGAVWLSWYLALFRCN